ncbi:uncharacterized protein isoform X3 [Musca autumnalis]|uniref:uncharacterized protein isoform X3 n=1 Tax=Musca autumnalis TaxID=221902 RepID=UPI003CF24541
MAAINPEDLEKLKKFIDFVSANPLILNVPQLGFLKRFIEKFGGKVPEGEYQMPAGGKCPFGGDAKTETKTQPPPTQDDDAAEPVVEEESEESEVELDMEETSNVKLFEPNVLYLDEKPPKIVKPQRTTKTKKKKQIKVDKTKHKKPTKKSKSKMAATTKETATDDGGDPLFTMDKPIKMEIDVDKTNEEHKDEKDYKDDNDIEMDFEEKKYPTFDAKELCETQLKYESNEEKETENAESEEEDDDAYGDYQDDSEESYKASSSSSAEDEDENDDEPLIVIAKRKAPPRPKGKRKKMPRVEQCKDACKQKCGQKFTNEQRQRLCQHFWSLTEEGRKQYIRQHTRGKVRRYKLLKKKSTKTCAPHFAYYLDGEVDECGADMDQQEKPLIRVCRKYFESTLRASNYTIKKALDGYEAEPEFDVKLIKKQIQEVTPQQFLDPETGNLITIDPKAKPEKNQKSCINTTDTTKSAKSSKTPKKRDDPPPEHHPKPINCAQRCIYKCHTNFSEEDRKQICDSFWSLDYNRRKDFILTRIETKDIEMQTVPEFRKTNRPPRAYHTRFFLRSPTKGENVRVCKHFLENTLSITRKFISNAIDFADKTTGHYTGCDRRGLHKAADKVDPERIQFIKDHITSYPYWLPFKKSKIRYLHCSLSIRRMYLQYREICEGQQKKFVSVNYYYKTFHDVDGGAIRFLFLSNPAGPTTKGTKGGGGGLKKNLNVSHYTGEEAGGAWYHPNGEQLDLSKHNPGESLMYVEFAAAGGLAPPTTVMKSSSLALEGSRNLSRITQQQQQGLQPMATAVAAPPQPPAVSAFNWNPSFSYAQFLDPALNPNLLGQHTGTTAAAAARTATAPEITTSSSSPEATEFNVSLYEHNLPQAHAASSSASIFRRL